MNIYLPKERFLRHGMIIMLICAVVLLGIGIFMFIEEGAFPAIYGRNLQIRLKCQSHGILCFFAGLLYLFITL